QDSRQPPAISHLSSAVTVASAAARGGRKSRRAAAAASSVMKKRGEQRELRTKYFSCFFILQQPYSAQHQVDSGNPISALTRQPAADATFRHRWFICSILLLLLEDGRWRGRSRGRGGGVPLVDAADKSCVPLAAHSCQPALITGASARDSGIGHAEASSSFADIRSWQRLNEKIKASDASAADSTVTGDAGDFVIFALQNGGHLQIRFFCSPRPASGRPPDEAPLPSLTDSCGLKGDPGRKLQVSHPAAQLLTCAGSGPATRAFPLTIGDVTFHHRPRISVERESLGHEEFLNLVISFVSVRDAGVYSRKNCWIQVWGLQKNVRFNFEWAISGLHWDQSAASAPPLARLELMAHVARTPGTASDQDLDLDWVKLGSWPGASELGPPSGGATHPPCLRGAPEPQSAQVFMSTTTPAARPTPVAGSPVRANGWWQRSRGASYEKGRVLND
uniref:SUN domain-containing protein n=1 Tax=Macrostomum lignano TaxID=282301 RepID=A0A1I8FK10_9PLAT